MGHLVPYVIYRRDIIELRDFSGLQNWLKYLDYSPDRQSSKDFLNFIEDQRAIEAKRTMIPLIINPSADDLFKEKDTKEEA